MAFIIQIKRPGQTPETLDQVETLEQARECLITALVHHTETLAPLLEPETLDALQTVIDDLRVCELYAGFRAYVPTSPDHDELPTLFQIKQ